MIVSIDEYERFQESFSDPEDATRKARLLYIEAAEEIVVNYLGWNPVKRDYKRTLSGNGKNWLQLGAKNIYCIEEITVDGKKFPGKISLPDQERESVNSDKVFPWGNRNIEASFSAGWDVENIPAIIKIIIIQIASLIESTAGQNIGITSKSFDMSGTRTFIQNRDFSEYLRKLDVWQVAKF